MAFKVCGVTDPAKVAGVANPAKVAGVIVPGGASITFGNSVVDNNGSGENLTIACPSGCTNNSTILIAWIAYYAWDATEAITNPSGWNTFADIDVVPNVDNVIIRLCWRLYQTGDGPFVWTLTNPANSSGAIVAVDGLNTTTPIEASTDTYTNGGNNSITVPAITTGFDGCAVLLLMYCKRGDSTAVFSNETVNSQAATEIYDINGGGAVAVQAVGAAYYTQASAGSSGTGYADVNVTEPVAGRMVSLRPA